MSHIPLHINMPQLLYPFVGHLGCFHVLTTLSNATVNIDFFFLISVCVYFKYIPWSGNAGSCGSSVFSFMRYLHTVFHSGSSVFHSCASYSPINSVQGFPFLCIFQHLLFVVILMTTILTGVRWYLIVV